MVNFQGKKFVAMAEKDQIVKDVSSTTIYQIVVDTA